MSIGDFLGHIGTGMAIGATYGLMSQLGGGFWGGSMGLFGGYPSLYGYGLFDCYYPHHHGHLPLHHQHHCHSWWC